MNTIESIVEDRYFLDNYYNSLKQLNALSDIGNVADENAERIFENCCGYYLTAVRHCFKMIEEHAGDERIRSVYLNWIRWNYYEILEILTNYEQHPLTDFLNGKIIKCRVQLDSINVNYFLFSASDNALSNEYVHAYNLIKSPRPNVRAVLQTGRLLINYINTLIKRYYYDKFDRDGLSSNGFKEEVDFILSKLRNIRDGSELMFSIGTAYELYSKIGEKDAIFKKQEDENIQQAIVRAKQIDEEAFIQMVQRKTRQAKQFIEQKLRQLTRNVSSALQPVLNPTKSLPSFREIIQHPLQSCKMIWDWVCANPLKMAGIVLGGVVIAYLTINLVKQVPHIIKKLRLSSAVNYLEQVATSNLRRLPENLMTKLRSKELERENQNLRLRNIDEEPANPIVDEEPLVADNEIMQQFRNKNAHEMRLILAEITKKEEAIEKELQTLHEEMEKTDEDLSLKLVTAMENNESLIRHIDLLRDIRQNIDKNHESCSSSYFDEDCLIGRMNTMSFD